MSVDKALGSIVARRMGTARAWFHDASIRQLTASAAWNALSVGLSRILNLLALVLASRVLGPDQFGQLGVVQNTMAMLGVFAGFGLGLTTTQQVSRWSRTDPLRTAESIRRLLGFSLTAGLAVAALAVVMAPWLATRMLSRPELSSALQMGSLLILFNAYLGVQQGTFVGLLAVRTAAIAQGFGGAALVAGLSVGAQWGGLQGCLLAQLLALGVQAIVGQYLLRKECRSRGIFLGLPLPCFWFEGMFAQALPCALSSILVIPVDWCVSVKLVQTTGSFHEAGLYAVACQWIAPMLLIPAAIGQSLLPLMSNREVAGGNARASFRLLWIATLMNGVVIAPILLSGIIYGRLLLSISGPDFVAAESMLTLLMLAAAIYTVEAPAGLYLVNHGWTWGAFGANLAWAVTFVGLVTFLVPYGGWGVAAARLTSYVLLGLWLLGIVCLLNRKLARHATL